MAVALAGTIWAGRCLGPEKLGISGLVISIATTLALIIGLQMNAAFVRYFKLAASEAEPTRCIDMLVSFRFFATLAISVGVVLVLPFLNIPKGWGLAILMGFPLLFVSSMDLTWVLTAQENVPAQQRINGLRALGASLCYFLFFRPGVWAGSDVVVSAVVGFAALVFAWRTAFAGRHVQISFRAAQACVSRIWENRNLITFAILLCVRQGFQMPLLAHLTDVFQVGLLRIGVQVATAAEKFLFMFVLLLYPRFIEWNTRDPELLWKRQWIILGTVLALTLAGAAVAFPLMPTIVPMAFGVAFQDAGLACAALLTSKLLFFGTELLVHAVRARHREGPLNWIVFGSTVVNLILFVLAVPAFGATGAAGAALATEAASLAGIAAFCWLDRRRAPRSKIAVQFNE